MELEVNTTLHITREEQLVLASLLSELDGLQNELTNDEIGDIIVSIARGWDSALDNTSSEIVIKYEE